MSFESFLAVERRVRNSPLEKLQITCNAIVKPEKELFSFAFLSNADEDVDHRRHHIALMHFHNSEVSLFIESERGEIEKWYVCV